MRDRLIELTKQAERTFSATGRPVLDIEEYVADHLLANGVIVQAQGHWIDQYKGKFANALYKCSACGGRANIDWITSDWNLTPFCPHCGAKMERSNENAE